MNYEDNTENKTQDNAAKAANTELFESMALHKAIIKLTVPTIMSGLVMVLYSLADTYFVGMLNDAVQNAAVTLAAPMLLAFNAINNLFGVGTSSMVSRALGAKDYDKVRKCSSLGIYCALAGGILISVLCTLFNTGLLRLLGADPVTEAATKEYLKWTVCLGAVPSILNVVLSFIIRSEGNSLQAGIGSMSGCLLNILLDPIFILPQFLNMGAAGAGLATMISNTFACIYLLVFIIRRRDKTLISLDPKDVTFDRAVIAGIMTVGLPAAIQNLLNVTGMTILNNFTAGYGADAVAAMGIAHKLAMIPFYVSMSYSQGVMPLIGYNFASGNRARMNKAIRVSLLISTVYMLLISLGFHGFSRELISLFMKTPAVVDYGEKFLKAMSLGIVFLSVDFFGVGIYQALGLGAYAFIFAVMRKIVLEIPAMFVLNRLYPLYGLAYSQTAAEIILAAAAGVILIRIMTGKLPRERNKL